MSKKTARIFGNHILGCHWLAKLRNTCTSHNPEAVFVGGSVGNEEYCTTGRTRIPSFPTPWGFPGNTSPCGGGRTPISNASRSRPAVLRPRYARSAALAIYALAFPFPSPADPNADYGNAPRRGQQEEPRTGLPDTRILAPPAGFTATTLPSFCYSLRRAATLQASSRGPHPFKCCSLRPIR